MNFQAVYKNGYNKQESQNEWISSYIPSTTPTGTILNQSKKSYKLYKDAKNLNMLYPSECMSNKILHHW